MTTPTGTMVDYPVLVLTEFALAVVAVVPALATEAGEEAEGIAAEVIEA